MARKQTKAPTKTTNATARKNGAQLSGGNIIKEKAERIEIQGSCDGQSTVISQPNNNGNVETIRWPKNTGDCGPWVVIRCLNAQDQLIPGTDVWIGRGKSIKSYTSPPTAQKIVFFCPDHDMTHGTACKIEIDRD